ncbi:MAG TPA: hypothetical protein VF720_08470 [Candidatus Eisenbacteria bacterium]
MAPRKITHRILIATLLAACAHAMPAASNTAYQSIPFFQNWSNTALLSTSDNWNNVPGIVGYLGENPIESTPGRLPRTITADSTSAPDLIPNQGDPSGIIIGGVAECQLTDPVVALQASATADHPYLVIHLNTTGIPAPLVFQCRLRDLDGSLDNTQQPIQVQYRTQASGSWTNAVGGDFFDVTHGPGLNTLQTMVSIVLPGVVGNRPQLQVRIMTANAVGNDEWVGIDDIYVTVATSGVPAPGSLEPTTWSRIKNLR